MNVVSEALSTRRPNASRQYWPGAAIVIANALAAAFLSDVYGEPTWRLHSLRKWL
ncbi:MAG: hypothetical protein JWR21_2239 [Herminiimonas sp.]|nr:hypothetical protein [Herminiimonas sp.]